MVCSCCAYGCTGKRIKGGPVKFPGEKKQEYMISRLIHHFKPDQPVSKDPKSSDVRRENHLKIKEFLKQNKKIGHVNAENAPFKKKDSGEFCNFLRNPQTLSNTSLAVKTLKRYETSVQPVAEPVNVLQKPPAKENIINKNKVSESFSGTSQFGNKRKTPDNTNVLQKPPAKENIINKNKVSESFSGTSQFGNKRKTPDNTNALQNQKANKISNTRELCQTPKHQEKKKTAGKTASKHLKDLENALQNQKANKISNTSELCQTPKHQKKKKTAGKTASKQVLEYTVCIKGVVKDSQHKKPLAKAKIEVLSNTKKIKDIFTTSVGEFECDIEMKLKKSYCVSASMKDYTTKEEFITLKNQKEKVINVNFNLVSTKTARNCKSELLITNDIGHLLELGYEREVAEEALHQAEIFIKKNQSATSVSDLVFRFLP